MGVADRGRETGVEVGPERQAVSPAEVVSRTPQAEHEASRRAALAMAARLFASGDPATILARISNEDPLRLYELGARRVRERFLFVDLERLQELSLAFVAHAAATTRGEQADENWLVIQMDRAIDSILAEDAQEQRSKGAPNDPEDSRYRTLAITVGVQPSLGRSAVVNFNALGERARRGFFRLLIENRTVEETMAEDSWKEPSDLRHDIWDGLRALGHLLPGEVLGQNAKKGRRKRS